MSRPRLRFVVESGTDVRLVDGLAERFELTVLARRIVGGVEISRTPEGAVTVRTGPASRVAFARMVWRELARVARTDRVLVQGYGLAALAANLAARRTGAPTTMLVCSPIELYYRQRRHHPAPDKPFRRFELWGMTRLARANARLARQYVVLSRHLADVVRSHGTPAPIDIIPVYGVDATVFRSATEPKAVLRHRRALPATGAIVFFSSRVAPEKDADTLLFAARHLLAEGHDLWLLHRSGGYREFLERARQVGVAERVIATDAVHPVTELPFDYQASDLLVQASREEGLGFSPLEALACGVPVVATSVGGLRETIIDGETGWTYPPGDAGALARSIAAALSDPAEARRRAETGQRMVNSRYERRAVFDRFAAALTAPPGVAMTELLDGTREGHYARKQIFSRSWLIAWSHRRRFETALALARGFVGRRVLDYGCGDGTFLALLMRGEHAPALAFGAEIAEDLVADCRTRLGAIPNLSFVAVSDLDRPEHRGVYDGVVCMEVLEHVVEIDLVLDHLVHLLARGGRLLISVPVETGLPLLVKQTVRRIAGWRGIGHYPGTTPYTWRELAGGLFAGPHPHLHRPVHQAAGGRTFHDHKGFNWMVLREKLAARLRIEAVEASPIRWLPPHLASQVWFLAKKREE